MPATRTTFAVAIALGSAAALGLEIVWARRLALVLGSTSLATGSVLAAFMLGLAGGARLGGRLAAQGRPARRFGLVQLAAAGLAPLPFGVALLPSAWQLPAALLATTIASLPLGAAFALAGRVRETDGSGLGGRLGRLAALDVGAAVAGCLAVGLIGLPCLGLSGCLAACAGLKLAAAGLAFGLAPAASDAPGRTPPAPARPSGSIGRLGLLVFGQGLALLGAEVIWSRLLAFVLYRGSSTYALTATLVCVLAAQASGAWTAARLVTAGRSAVGLATGFATACAASLLGSLALLLVAGPVPSQAAVGPVDLLITLLACGPASFCSGAVFAAACTTGDAGHAGRLLFANALGAGLGALAAPLWLIPGLGLSGALVALGLLPAVLASRLRRAGWLRRALVTTGLAALGCGLWLAGPTWTRHLGRIHFYREGPQASVAVVEDPPGVRRLYVDGVAVAGTDLALATDQKGLAHLPVLLHGRAESVLTVGFGAGGTSDSLLRHPDLQVTCVEISASVLAAAGHLTQVNRGLLARHEPRFHLVEQDARRLLASTDQRWDVIVNDCTDLAYRADAGLYTRDFFERIRAHLAPGGLAAAWIPLRGEPPYASLRSVVAAFAGAFPRASLWVFDSAPVHFGILVGTEEPLVVDLDRLATRLQRLDGVRADLAPIGLADPARLAATRALDGEGLRRFAGSAAAHTDDRPVVEFLAPLEGGDDESAYAALSAAGPPSAPVPVIARDVHLRRRLGRRLLQRPWLLAGHRARLADRPEQARRLYLTALRLSPDDALAQGLLGLQAPGAVDDPARRGVIRLLRGDRPGARADLEQALDERPADPALRLALGLALGFGPRAQELLLEAAVSDRPPVAERARRALVFERLGPLLGAALESLTNGAL